MRDRRACLQRVWIEHPDVSGIQSGGQIPLRGLVEGEAVPGQRSIADGRALPLRIGHLGPEQAAGLVIEKMIVDRESPLQGRSGGTAGEGRDAQSMTDLVHHHIEQVDLRTRVVVGPVIEARSPQAIRVAVDVGIEAGLHFGVAGIDVTAIELIGQARGIPGVCQGRTAESRVVEGARETQRAAAAAAVRAGEALPVRPHDDRAAPRQPFGPARSGEIEYVQPLLPQGRARIRRQGGARRRVVEPLSRGIVHLDDEAGGPGRAGQQQETEREARGAEFHGLCSGPAA